MHLLSLAMFIAQWGMIAHATGHLKVDPHATPTPMQLCGECLAFAPLHNAVGSAPAITLAFKPAVHSILDCQAAPAIAPRAFDAFRSRAPPVFL